MLIRTILIWWKARRHRDAAAAAAELAAKLNDELQGETDPKRAGDLTIQIRRARDDAAYHNRRADEALQHYREQSGKPAEQSRQLTTCERELLGLGCWYGSPIAQSEECRSTREEEMLRRCPNLPIMLFGGDVICPTPDEVSPEQIHAMCLKVFGSRALPDGEHDVCVPNGVYDGNGLRLVVDPTCDPDPEAPTNPCPLVPLAVLTVTMSCTSDEGQPCFDGWSDWSNRLSAYTDGEATFTLPSFDMLGTQAIVNDDDAGIVEVTIIVNHRLCTPSDQCPAS